MFFTIQTTSMVRYRTVFKIKYFSFILKNHCADKGLNLMFTKTDKDMEDFKMYYTYTSV